MKFILPRLLGLAVIAGIASFVLAMIFKLLIGVIIIGTLAYFATRLFSKRHKQDAAAHYGGQYMTSPFGNGPQHPYPDFGQYPMPVRHTSGHAAIIPIN